MSEMTHHILQDIWSRSEGQHVFLPTAYEGQWTEGRLSAGRGARPVSV
jgi:hypothetical protein